MRPTKIIILDYNVKDQIQFLINSLFYISFFLFVAFWIVFAFKTQSETIPFTKNPEFKSIEDLRDSDLLG